MRGGVHGVLDDPHRDRRPVGLAARVQLGQVGAVGQHPDRGQPETTPRPATGCAPRWPARRGPGSWDRKLRSASTSIPGPNAGQQVPGQGLLPDGVRAERRPDQRPGPRLGRGQPPDLRERPVPRRRSTAARSARRSRRAVRHVGGRAVHRHHPQPAAEHPRRVRPPPTGPATCSNSMCSGSAPSRARARASDGDVRRPPPPTRPGIDPAVRVEDSRPAAAVPAPPVIQRVHQLDHHPPVTAVPAPEQPQRQHEVHHQPSRQQPARDLPGVGRVHHPIHQLRRERPGQRPHRHPIGQPALRRDPQTRHAPQNDHVITSHAAAASRDHAIESDPYPGPSGRLIANISPLANPCALSPAARQRTGHSRSA